MIMIERQDKFVEGPNSHCKLSYSEFLIYSCILSKDRYKLYRNYDIYLTQEEFNTVLYNEKNHIDYDLYVNVLDNEYKKMINQSELRQKYIDRDAENTKNISYFAIFSGFATLLWSFIIANNNINGWAIGLVFGILFSAFMLSVWYLNTTKDRLDALVYSVKFIKTDEVTEEEFI